MPAYNVGPFVRRAITSILNQTFEDFELLVIDDGSTDDTWKEASKCKSDPRLRLFQNSPNQGLSKTRNRLLHESRGTLIALADADDIFSHERLQKQVAFLEAHPDVGVLGGNAEYIDRHGKTVGTPTNLPQNSAAVRFFLMLGPCLVNTITMYRQHLMHEAGGYRSGFDAGAEDYDLWCRLSRITNLANLPEPMATVHVHSGSVTASSPGHKANIFPIARGLLAEYLNEELTDADARGLLTLYWHGLNRSEDPNRILWLVRKLCETAASREHEGINAELHRRTHRALWIYGQSIVYVYPSASVQIMKEAIKLRPSSIASRELAGYVGRLLTPTWLRATLKGSR